MADPIKEYLKIINRDIEKHWGSIFSMRPGPIKKMQDAMRFIPLVAAETVHYDPAGDAANVVSRLASEQLIKHKFERGPSVDGQLGEYAAVTDEAKKYLKTTRGQFYFKHAIELERIIRQQNKLSEEQEQKQKAAPSMRKG